MEFILTIEKHNHDEENQHLSFHASQIKFVLRHPCNWPEFERCRALNLMDDWGAQDFEKKYPSSV